MLFIGRWQLFFDVSFRTLVSSLCVRVRVYSCTPLWCPSGTCCSSLLTWWGPCGPSPAPVPPRRPATTATTCAPSSGPVRSSASPAGPAAPPPGWPRGSAPGRRWTGAAWGRKNQDEMLHEMMGNCAEIALESWLFMLSKASRKYPCSLLERQKKDWASKKLITTEILKCFYCNFLIVEIAWAHFWSAAQTLALFPLFLEDSNRKIHVGRWDGFAFWLFPSLLSQSDCHFRCSTLILRAAVISVLQ